MTQTTLKELVQGTVEGFLVTNSPFSVYDVTQSIRNLVNSGAVEVPSQLVTGQAFKYDIDHNDVKFYFNVLSEEDVFSQPLTRTYNGSYFTYQGIAPTNTPNPIQNVRNALSNMGTALGQFKYIAKPKSAASTVRQAAASSNKLDRSEVIKRVRTYQTNCSSRNFNPTTKQIQSAIKRGSKSTGWTRSELATIWQGISTGTI